MVGEWIEKSYGVSYTRSALIKLLQRIEVEYCKPKLIPRKLDPAQQQAFIATYENLLNNLGDNEAVLFADAVHPTHEARPAGCWAPKDAKVALEQTSGRQRLNIHGAIDLETGATRMIEATTIDALSTIALLMAISLMYPTKRLIHVFVDNAGTTMPCSFRNGWQDRGAGSGFITFRATARTLIRSSACGD